MRDIEAAARAIAIEAGDLLRAAAAREKVVHFKGAVDLVTETDRQAERRIVELIRKRYPDHRIVAEEGSADALGTNIGADEWVWYVDPLDGTTNFAHGYPHFAVSIGVARGAQLCVGAVHDPMRRETFSAHRGGGAFLDERPIHVSSCSQLSGALMGTGFPYDRQQQAEYYLSFVAEIMKRAQGIRRGGTASLDLCYVACGRLDGFWELKLKPWDVAAGAIIIEEAGGTVSDFTGGRFSVYGEQVLATNGEIHAQVSEVLAAKI